MAVSVEDRVTEAAREAVAATAGDESSVGPMLGSEPGADGLISVRFACTLPGYNGWEWAADLAVIEGTVTVCESALLPGGGALLAPTWVPWSERVQPGDLEAGMILPYQAEDQRLIPGYTETGDEDRDAIAIFEFGLGRERVLAPEARESAAQRWYRGSHGPTAASAVAAGAACSTCAFVVPVSGSMRTMFGVCANEWSPSDGRVVSMDHGCGAHSQTDAERRASEWPAVDPVVDSAAVDVLDLLAPDVEPEPEQDAVPAQDSALVDGSVPVDGSETEPKAEGEPESVMEAAPDGGPLTEPVVSADAEDSSAPESNPQDAEQDKAPEAPAE